MPLQALELAESDITAEATFDEFSLNVSVRYRGRLPAESGRSGFGGTMLGLAERNVASMASRLLYRLADRVRLKSTGTHCEIELHFEH